MLRWQRQEHDASRRTAATLTAKAEAAGLNVFVGRISASSACMVEARALIIRGRAVSGLTPWQSPAARSAVERIAWLGSSMPRATCGDKTEADAEVLHFMRTRTKRSRSPCAVMVGHARLIEVLCSACPSDSSSPVANPTGTEKGASRYHVCSTNSL